MARRRRRRWPAAWRLTPRGQVARTLPRVALDPCGFGVDLAGDRDRRVGGRLRGLEHAGRDTAEQCRSERAAGRGRGPLQRHVKDRRDDPAPQLRARASARDAGESRLRAGGGDQIEAVCQRHGVELGAAAMQFPLFHPAVCSVIPGALSVAEAKQNVARLSAKIPVELWSELKREKLLDPNAPTPN